MKLGKKVKYLMVVLVALTTIVGLSDIAFIIPSNNEQADTNNISMQKVSLKTQDGKDISGNYFQVQNPIGWILYLHMMPSTKESYSDIANLFASNGYAGLAIDFRGHGESSGGPDGYNSFSDEEHQNSYSDVLAGIDFLVQNGADKSKVSIIGASIGANIALKYASENNEIKKIVLLSPGLDYRGVKTEEFVKKLKVGQNVMFVGSVNDILSNNKSNIEDIEKLY